MKIFIAVLALLSLFIVHLFLSETNVQKISTVEDERQVLYEGYLIYSRPSSLSLRIEEIILAGKFMSYVKNIAHSMIETGKICAKKTDFTSTLHEIGDQLNGQSEDLDLPPDQITRRILSERYPCSTN
ncbi:hypothetical protein PU345_003705 [Enterobacter kobei]|nr:hypothetical protein [Enterobacter kobei]